MTQGPARKGVCGAVSGWDTRWEGDATDVTCPARSNLAHDTPMFVAPQILFALAALQCGCGYGGSH